MVSEFRPVYEAAGALPIRLEVAEVEHPVGRRYLHHRLVVGEGRPGVVVAARHGERLLLVRSNRISTGRLLWELPRGSSEVEDAAGGDPFSDAALVRAALRELREETGRSGSEARVIGRFYTDTAVFPQPVGAVLCDVDPAEPVGETDGEVEEQRWFTRSELAALSGEGTVDGFTLAVLGLLSAR